MSVTVSSVQVVEQVPDAGRVPPGVFQAKRFYLSRCFAWSLAEPRSFTSNKIYFDRPLKCALINFFGDLSSLMAVANAELETCDVRVHVCVLPGYRCQSGSGFLQ